MNKVICPNCKQWSEFPGHFTNANVPCPHCRYPLKIAPPIATKAAQQNRPHGRPDSSTAEQRTAFQSAHHRRGVVRKRRFDLLRCSAIIGLPLLVLFSLTLAVDAISVIWDWEHPDGTYGYTYSSSRRPQIVSRLASSGKGIVKICGRDMHGSETGEALYVVMDNRRLEAIVTVMKERRVQLEDMQGVDDAPSSAYFWMYRELNDDGSIGPELADDMRADWELIHADRNSWTMSLTFKSSLLGSFTSRHEITIDLPEDETTGRWKSTSKVNIITDRGIRMPPETETDSGLVVGIAQG